MDNDIYINKKSIDFLQKEFNNIVKQISKMMQNLAEVKGKLIGASDIRYARKVNIDMKSKVAMVNGYSKISQRNAENSTKVYEKILVKVADINNKQKELDVHMKKLQKEIPSIEDFKVLNHNIYIISKLENRILKLETKIKETASKKEINSILSKTKNKKFIFGKDFSDRKWR